MAYDLTQIPFEVLLWEGIQKLTEKFATEEDKHHFEKTPERYLNALKEYISGYDANIEEILKGFDEVKYNQMIFVNDTFFISHCAHHLAPFIGKIHFAYIPKNKIVGLSKIPRLISVLSHRFQIQEKLSDDIVDNFQKYVEPQGCGVVIEAVHLCMLARGIRQVGSYTRTVSLRGTFLDSEKVKVEFLMNAVSKEKGLL